MKHKLLIILAVLTIVACQDKKQVNLFTSDDIKAQVFYITADKDTTLTGEGGTTLTIEKNTFIDQKGNQASGEIKIEFKECLDRLDMVLGNMTTTANGQFLESGGMVYINATSNNQQLAISDGMSIGVEMPCDSILNNMQVFEGLETKNGINWQNPVGLKNQEIDMPKVAEEFQLEEKNILQRSNVGYYVRGYHYTGSYPNHTFLKNFKPIPRELDAEVGAIVWSGNGLILTKDSVIQIDTFEVALVKIDTLGQIEVADLLGNGSATEGQNQFQEDKQTNYIFSIKKLGWANIDRLFSDPRTKEIELIVLVDNVDDFDEIFVSMIFNNQSMYLPGYQKKDKSFSFTHGDFEKTSLPVGEITTVLITAYKDDKPFYAIKTFTIKEQQLFNLQLSPTTKKELKIELEKQI